MMDNQLEQVRDIWVNAFFTGNYEVLAQYEDEHFKVVYEQADRVESNYTRYEKIAHAVKNGVWKPQKPDVEFENLSLIVTKHAVRSRSVWLKIANKSKKHGSSIRDGKYKNYVF